MVVNLHADDHPHAYNQTLECAGVVGAGGGSMAGHLDTNDEAHTQKLLGMLEQTGVGMQVLSPAPAPAGARP
jgi:hypothetical protein